ncbi:MAG: response regulator [Calditrichaeota bacterium]|nr:MAG: response regulator [Calditrichota bacterium]MBL1207402.1 response regulator [Calditrichota bacterium]NOG47234.1 response regulator [Calditrichota bacterium]
MNDFHVNLRKKNFLPFVGASIFSVIVNPLWGIFDYFLEPGLWFLFLKFRLGTALLHIISLIVISRPKFRHFSIEGIWLLAVSIELEIALMFPFLETNIYPYTLGFTLPFLIITIITAIPFLYSLSAMAISVLAFIVGFYVRPYPISFEETLFLSFFVSTSFGVGLLSSFLNYRIVKNEYYMHKKLDQLKSNFFANITHEFRTPLTLILGPVQNLLEKYPNSEDNQDYNLIKKNALRLQNLINQLLDLSRMESGKLTLHASRQNIVGLSKSILSTFESHAVTRNIELTFKSSFQRQELYIDFDKYEKILTNLLFNAFKFSEDGSEIILSISKNEKHVSIEIEDRGIGIAPDQLTHVFERFYQVEAGSTRSYEGSGIGLALVKELVDLHYGQISVKSVPGIGTTFTLKFLLGTGHLSKSELIDNPETKSTFVNAIFTDSEDVESLSEHNGELPCVLVVEDNLDMQKYINSFLSNDYHILFANDGLEGFQTAKDKIPDLIICDVMMPVMNGFELCRNLKTDFKTSHIPLIMLTAKADIQDKLKGLESGADEYLYKPFSGKELTVRTRNLLEQRRKLQQKFATNIFISPSKLDIGHTDKTFLDEVLNTIQKNIDNPDFHVDDLADKMSLSRVHLHRKLKALVDKSTTEFIRSYRLQHAAKLLSEKNYNVGEIAFRVGFNNLSYFSDSFKKQYGVLPSDYVK